MTMMIINNLKGRYQYNKWNNYLIKNNSRIVLTHSNKLLIQLFKENQSIKDDNNNKFKLIMTMNNRQIKIYYKIKIFYNNNGMYKEMV